MSELPDYHCPDCRDINCLHCFCVVSTVCETCEAFREGEQVSHTPDQPDKGYTTGFYDGKQAQQDRIIKLLQEDAESQTEYCKPLDSEHCHTCFEAVRLIKLIEGENK